MANFLVFLLFAINLVHAAPFINGTELPLELWNVIARYSYDEPNQTLLHVMAQEMAGSDPALIIDTLKHCSGRSSSSQLSVLYLENFNQECLIKLNRRHFLFDQVVVRSFHWSFIEGILADPEIGNLTESVFSKAVSSLQVFDCDQECFERIASFESYRLSTLAIVNEMALPINAESVATVFSASERISSFYLSSTELDDEFMIAFSKSAIGVLESRSRIEALIFENGEVTDEGACALSNAILESETMPTIGFLGLRNLRLSANFLSQGASPLIDTGAIEALDLSHNGLYRHLMGESIHFFNFGRSLVNASESFQSLILSDCDLDFRVISVMFDNAANGPAVSRLKHLDLSYNLIDTYFIYNMEKLVSESRHLEYLNLGHSTARVLPKSVVDSLRSVGKAELEIDFTGIVIEDDEAFSHHHEEDEVESDDEYEGLPVINFE